MYKEEFDGDYEQHTMFVLTLHPHWKTLLWPGLLLFVVIVAAAALLIVIPPGRLAGPGRIAVGVVAVVLAVAGLPLRVK